MLPPKIGRRIQQQFFLSKRQFGGFQQKKKHPKMSFLGNQDGKRGMYGLCRF